MASLPASQLADARPGPLEDTLHDLLGGRLDRIHLRQRIGLESEQGQHVLGYGRNFFHLENWYTSHAVIRGVLRLTGLHGRARRNALDIRVHRRDMAVPGLPPAFAGLRILHLSDLHLDMNADFPGVLSERVRGLEYDFCVITGDFRFLTHGPIDAAMDAMARIREHLRGPVYGILGNHDSIRMVPRLEGMGIHMLMNESLEIRRGGDAIHLAGVDDPHYYRVDNLERACRGIPAGAVSLLLAHTPEIYRQAAHAGFHVMFCGHTHGGQIRLPGGLPVITNARCPRRFCAGYWRHGQLQGYTSLGTGSSVVDVRLNCPPEVVLHRLVP